MSKDAKKPTQIQLAKELGLTKGRVTQLKQRGMPMDSAVKASRWMALNLDDKKKHHEKPKGEVSVVDFKVVEKASDPKGGGVTIEEELMRLKETADFCYRKMNTNKGDIELYIHWQRQYVPIANQVLVMEEKLTKIQRDQESVVDVEDLNATFTKIIQSIVTEADRLPARMGKPLKGEIKITFLECAKIEIGKFKDKLKELDVSCT